MKKDLIFIIKSDNGLYGVNLENYFTRENNAPVYMSEEQLFTCDLDDFKNEVDTSKISNKLYYTYKDLRVLERKYKLQKDTLINSLDWQEPETLCEDLRG